jgi:hypothetical protein
MINTRRDEGVTDGTVGAKEGGGEGGLVQKWRGARSAVASLPAHQALDASLASMKGVQATSTGCAQSERPSGSVSEHFVSPGPFASSRDPGRAERWLRGGEAWMRRASSLCVGVTEWQIGCMRLYMPMHVCPAKPALCWPTGIGWIQGEEKQVLWWSGVVGKEGKAGRGC